MEIIPNPLIETGENDAVPEEKTPLQMAQEAHEGASVGWVKRELEQHGKRCPSIRVMRSFRAYLLIGAGFISCASILGTVTIRAEMRADRLEIKDEFRSILREEIGGKLAALAPVITPPITSVAAASTPAPVVAPSAVNITPRRQLPPSRARLTLPPINFVQAAQ